MAAKDDFECAPSKTDIQNIFKRLRAIPSNKSCFDCNAKNPTWSSVTYGVFICIDCSAVHRSLGVHVTFVRSTQLDLNWTWLQIRQMQLGGNANASVFFRQHNCNTTDAQEKYKSRAAQLYKEKLHQTATQAMRTYGTQLYLDSPQEKVKESEEKELDFFEEITSININKNVTDIDSFTIPPKQTIQQPVTQADTISNSASLGGPSVNLGGSADTIYKPTIGMRKAPAKRTGLGSKKGGFGAQKVKTNFAEIEKEAELLDQLKMKQPEVQNIQENEDKQMTSMRLAYQDISLQKRKEEEKLIKNNDPKKAQQMDRLGMGFASKSGISHSALSDMKTIEQETPMKSTHGAKSSYDSENNESFFDDYVLSSSSYGMYRSSPSSEKLSSAFDNNKSDIFTEKKSTKNDDWTFVDNSNIESNVSSWDSKPRKETEKVRSSNITSDSSSASGDAQKKFGNAKAISSAQYFGNTDTNTWERKSNLSRFEGSTSISSADYFDDGTNKPKPSRSAGMSSSISVPDLDDVRESVRQGVTKVAGKVSSLANGVMSSIQDRYGY